MREQLQSQLSRFVSLGAIDEPTRQQLAEALATHLAEPDTLTTADPLAGIEFVEAEVVAASEDVPESAFAESAAVDVLAEDSASEDATAELPTQPPPSDVTERVRR